jgi:hypothetical protein
MWDNVTEGWIAKKENGDVVMNDMRRDVCQFVYDTPVLFSGNRDYGWYWKQVVGEVATYQAFAGLFIPTLPLITATTHDAQLELLITRLHAQIRSAGMDALTAFAELDKSVGSLNRLFRSALHLFKNAKSIRSMLHRGAVTAAQAADAYLEIRYGLRPIYYDVIATIEALQSLGETKRQVLHLHHGIEDTISAPSVVAKRSGTTQTGVSTTFNVIDGKRTVARAGAVLDFKIADADLFSEFDLDIIQTAWELVPFSFIADWFLNIGDLLNSWSPVYDVTVKGTYVVLQEEVRRSAYATKVYSYTLGSWLQDVSHNGTTVKLVRTRRYANPSRPWLPHLNIRLDGLKLLDLLSIFGGLVTDFSRWKI